MKGLRPVQPATLFLMACILGLGSGGAAWIAGRHPLADALWAGTAGLALIPGVVMLVHGLLKRSAGVDVIEVTA